MYQRIIRRCRANQGLLWILLLLVFLLKWRSHTVQRKGVINYNADSSLWIKGSSLCFQSPYTVSLEQPIQDKQLYIYARMKCTITNIATLKSTPSQLTIKLSFFFEYPMAVRTICSSSETSNEIISIKSLQ